MTFLPMARSSKDDLTQANQLIELLAAMGRRSSLRDPIASAVEATELTTAQIHALLWLGRDNALTMGEIAQRVGMSEKGVTGLIDRLEKLGYAQRERDTSDRRVVRVVLAPKGSEIHQRLSQEILEKTAAFLDLMEEEDRAALFRMLERLLQKMEQPARVDDAT